ncbi:MAG: DUF2723 domain-containing protein [Bacteroidetes bacterium]|nr:DUF2723 domain-containing protein [Bacteroidota bacterium]
MRGYKFYNNLFGGIAGLIALISYQLTIEQSVSLWDCGEFIAASYKLMVVHPPGAPFFLMLGRIFSMFAPNPADVGYWVNTLSTVASALAVMFTFWIVTYYAKKLLTKGLSELSTEKYILIFGAGFVGSLAMTYMDSFWFSAVEAEVYALSSCFTMATFWAALKWESSSSKHADKWLVMIGLLIGLSIGTHLLSLLVIPAVAFIYYFKKVENPTWKGGIIAFVLGFLILTFIQNLMLPGIPKLMSIFDLFFVNTLGFGFNTGSLVAILLVVMFVVGGIIYSINKGKRHLNFAFVTLAYILLGYSSYAMVVIRSSVNPPIDMNNPADPFNLLSYINREQYGDRPLLYGPYFNADVISSEQGSAIWTKGDKGYIKVGNKQEYEYQKDMQTFFPRMGDMQKEGSAAGYRLWGGMADIQSRIDQLTQQINSSQDQQNAEQLRSQLMQYEKTKPSFANDMAFFMNYQLGYMYLRYFMWNFAGRQNDQQGHYFNKEFDGNWISGVAPIDNMRLGPQGKMPKELNSNFAKNKFYFLPLILGILGIIFQYKNSKNDFIVNLIFFLYTGILIVVYLNMPPFEPRERDYAVVGSFQVFCIWIGLGVLMMWQFLKKYIKSGNMAAITASAVSLLAAPVIMGAQGWNDHDRSGRRLAIDFAIDYLESCAPNAILFTNGDNDTYPLWYAQNVEGIRTDIRIINMSLLPTDWYSSILLDKVYNSDPLPLTFTKEDLRAGNNEFVRYYPGNFDQEKFYPLADVMKFIKDPNQLLTDQSGGKINYLPVQNFIIKVDKEAVIENKVVPMEDTGSIIDELRFSFNRQYMHKGDMVFFDLISNNAKTGWKRPIYFTTTTGRGAYYGLEKYFQLEGLAYRLVPIENRPQGGTPTRLAHEILYKNLMEKFKWFNMKEKKNFFMDEKSILVPQNLQNVFVQFASDLEQSNRNLKTELNLLENPTEGMPAAPEGRKEWLVKRIDRNKDWALKLLDKVFIEIPESILPMRGQTKYYAALTYYDLDEKEKAIHHMTELYQRNLALAKYLHQFDGRTQFTSYAMSMFSESIQFIDLAKQAFEKWGMEDMKNKIEAESTQYRDLAKKLGIIN